MNERKKRLALVLLAATLLSLMLLSGPLTGLELQSGGAFPGSNSTGEALQPQVTQPAEAASTFPIALQGVIALAAVVIAIILAARLIARVDLGRVLLWVAVLVILIVLAISLPHVTPGPPATIAEESLAATPNAQQIHVAPLESPPPEWDWLVTAGVLVALGAVTWLLLKRRRPRSTASQLLEKAQEAVQAIQAGEAVSGVIFRCYTDMARVVHQQRELKRERQMTVREFEERITATGIPAEPVRQIGRLFEQARYGDIGLSKQDEAQAVQSLDEIVSYLRAQRA